MRQILLIIITFLVAANVSFGQTGHLVGKPSYKVVGRILSSAVDDQKSFLVITLKVHWTFTNKDDVPILVWKHAPPLVGKTISKSAEFGPEDILAQSVGGPSFDVSEGWRILRTSLNEPFPPQDLVRTLRKGEAWIFESELNIVAKKGNKRQAADITTQDLHLLDAIWIKAYFEAWSPNIEPNVVKDSHEKPFGRTLQKRWSNYGYLLIDNLITEPIKVDLTYATR